MAIWSAQATRRAGIRRYLASLALPVRARERAQRRSRPKKPASLQVPSLTCEREGSSHMTEFAQNRWESTLVSLWVRSRSSSDKALFKRTEFGSREYRKPHIRLSRTGRDLQDPGCTGRRRRSQPPTWRTLWRPAAPYRIVRYGVCHAHFHSPGEGLLVCARAPLPRPLTC